MDTGELISEGRGIRLTKPNLTVRRWHYVYPKHHPCPFVANPIHLLHLAPLLADLGGGEGSLGNTLPPVEHCVPQEARTAVKDLVSKYYIFALKLYNLLP